MKPHKANSNIHFSFMLLRTMCNKSEDFCPSAAHTFKEKLNPDVLTELTARGSKTKTNCWTAWRKYQMFFPIYFFFYPETTRVEMFCFILYHE